MSPRLWLRSEKIAEVVSEGRIVLLNLADPYNSDPVILTGTGQAIWSRLPRNAGALSSVQLVEGLANDLGFQAADILGDVEAFLVQLSDVGLVVTGNGQ